METAIYVVIGIGVGLGFLGGLIGTWVSIRNTQSPRERRFMIQASGLMWGFVSSFIALFWVLPMPIRVLMIVPYLLSLFPLIQWMNRAQSAIRHGD